MYDQEKRELKTHKPFLIKFFAPWCAHCQALSPIWDQLYVEYSDSFNILKVDCTIEETRELCIQFKVKGYPSILLLKHNHYYKHKGERTIDAIVEFASGRYDEAEVQGRIPPKVPNP